jgi:hypothetical protein
VSAGTVVRGNAEGPDSGLRRSVHVICVAVTTICLNAPNLIMIMWS